MQALSVKLPELDEMTRICGWLARLGLSEGAGGNLSVRLDGNLDAVESLEGIAEMPLPVAAPRLSGAHLLLTGTGTRARDISEDPSLGVGLFRVLPDGNSMLLLQGNDKPTSELSAHIAIHETLMETRPSHRAVLHSHPSRIIALTLLPEFQDSWALSDALFSLQSEGWFHVPEGVAHLPYFRSGSMELALQSAEAVKRGYNAILWHMHGAVTCGKTLSSALDTLQVVDKLAEIYWIVTTAGRDPMRLTQQDIHSYLEHFGVLDRHLSTRHPERESEKD